MKKTLGWIGLLVMGTGMMVAPAMANGRENTHYRISKTTFTENRDQGRRDDRDRDRNRRVDTRDARYVNYDDGCVRR